MRKLFRFLKRIFYYDATAHKLTKEMIRDLQKQKMDIIEAFEKSGRKKFSETELMKMDILELKINNLIFHDIP